MQLNTTTKRMAGNAIKNIKRGSKGLSAGLSAVLINTWFMCKVLWFIATTYLAYLFAKDNKKFMKELCETLARKNVLYVKLFQSVSLNAKFIDEDLHSELLKYTDNVFWEPSNIDWDMVFRLETNHDICFDGGYKPINSGMISVVFKVLDKTTGEHVALKMKRKNIALKLEQAIKEFEMLAYLASFVPMFKALQLEDIIKENIKTVKDQTDFRMEIRNLNEIRANCAHLNYIKIPKVRNEFLQYEDIIVMDFIEGVTISGVDEGDRVEFAKLIIKFAYVNLLVHGVMHADLHAGNILFIKNERNVKSQSLKERRTPKYQIGVIDFGILCKIENHYKNILYNIFESIQRVPSKKFVEIAMYLLYDFEPHLEQIGGHHYEKMLEKPTEIVEKAFYGDSKVTINILFELCNILFHIQCYLKEERVLKSPLLMNEDFIKMQTILAMVQGVILKLCGETCVPLMNEVFHEMFNTSLFLEQ